MMVGWSDGGLLVFVGRMIWLCDGSWGVAVASGVLRFPCLISPVVSALLLLRWVFFFCRVALSVRGGGCLLLFEGALVLVGRGIFLGQ
jgi:hypothetical protein